MRAPVATIAVAAVAVAAGIGATGCDFPWDFSAPYPGDTGTDTAGDTAGDTGGDTALDADADTDGADAPPPCTESSECDDGIECTIDRCEDASGTGHCLNVLPDDDSDGYMAASCTDANGSSGSDCDDTDPTFYPGADVLACAGAEDRNCDGFADLDGDGDGYDSIACGGDDCDPTDGAVYPGATEVACNGKDDDCAGGDEGYGMMLASNAALALTTHTGEYRCSAIWDGGEFLVVFTSADGDGVDRTTFMRVDVDGGVTAGPSHVDRYPGDGVIRQAQPSAVLTETGDLAVAWVDRRPGRETAEVVFGFVDRDGNLVGDVGVVSDAGDSEWPEDTSVLGTGSELVVGWRDYRSPTSGHATVYATRVDMDGNKIGSDVRVSDADGHAYLGGLALGVDASGDPAIGVAWSGTTSDGTYMGAVASWAPIDMGAFSPPSAANDFAGGSASSIAFSGSEWAMVWGDAEIGFTRFDLEGHRIGGFTYITDSPGGAPNYPSMAWTGSEYGVAFVDGRLGSTRVWLARVSAAGETIGTELPATYGGSSSVIFPVVVWAGDRYGVFWIDRVAGDEEWIFYNAVGGCT